MRFALHGPMFSGKTTLARLLMLDHGYTWLNYTDFGKELCAKALSALLDREVTRQEVIERKNEWRDFIIQALRIYGFDEGNGVDEMLSWTTDEHIVFDNVRYQSQYDKLKAHGFILVRLVISDHEQMLRANQTEMPVTDFLRLREESSECPLDPQEDEVTLCVDDKTPAELASQLLGLARIFA